MIKTDTFFVISNFNTIPNQYLEYCNNYLIYDQSNDNTIIEQLKVSNWNVSFVKHTGHNLSDYFRFIIDYYHNLPDCIMFLKGNIIGRHLTKSYFEKVYNNKIFTPLYNDDSFKDSVWVANLLYEGIYIEINTDWYVESKPHNYFQTYNQLLEFIFVNPIIPKWLIFSPGACYIVPKNNILKYPKEFYTNLYFLVTYRFFPVEAYHVERMMQVIFTGNYLLNDYMFSTEAFLEVLKNYSMNTSRIVKTKEQILSFRNLISLVKMILYYKAHNWKLNIKRYIN
ncbi:MAG: DUF3431 domain-containing protein [Flavobacterium sp.]|jgi:hypothetical protein|nr:DUF3431 domain-containing protein [Flavobacterium sp.]